MKILFLIFFLTPLVVVGESPSSVSLRCKAYMERPAVKRAMDCAVDETELYLKLKSEDASTEEQALYAELADGWVLSSNLSRVRQTTYVLRSWQKRNRFAARYGSTDRRTGFVRPATAYIEDKGDQIKLEEKFKKLFN